MTVGSKALITTNMNSAFGSTGKRSVWRIASVLALSGFAFAHLHAQVTVTLTPTDHHGFDVSCFGSKDGAIHAQASGGVPPYTYSWSTGAQTEDVSGLSAGYYGVTVKDNTGADARGEITLREPDPLKYNAQVQEYPNGFNISCYQCYNGNIQITPIGGVAPFTYVWKDGPTTQNRSGLGEDALAVTITDVNGCYLQSETYQIRSPERTDWTMSGNANTTPGTQYIGTSDNKDLVFKSNGQEGLRLKSDGALKATSLAFDHGYSLVMVDSTGQLKLLTDHNSNDAPLAITCNDHGSNLPWTFCGNIVFPTARLGTRNNVPLRLISNDQERMILHTNGKVGIGTTPPPGPIDQYRLFVEDGIVTRDVLAKTGPWPDYVFDKDYELLSIDDFRKYIADNRHLPGLPSAAEVEMKGGVELGDNQTRLVRVLEEQARYILILEERLTAAEKKLASIAAPTQNR